MMNITIEKAVKAAVLGGAEIMKVYGQKDFGVEIKNDDSPLTLADMKCNEVINSYLIQTGIPIISEENRQISYEERKAWELLDRRSTGRDQGVHQAKRGIHGKHSPGPAGEAGTGSDLRSCNKRVVRRRCETGIGIQVHT